MESIKYPLESRIWFLYRGQPSADVAGTLDKPTFIGRVLDDGSTQSTQLTYNDFGHITSITDPNGRQTSFDYYDNGIDLMDVYQGSSKIKIASFGPYNAQHRPSSYTDAAGQTTSYMYNGVGQLTQITDPLENITKFNHDSMYRLMNIINADGKIQTSFTYDSFSRIQARTDSEGYTVGYFYDAMDRLIGERYPDATARIYAYDDPKAPLDLHTITDRKGNTTTFDHDSVRNLVMVTDPLKHVTKFAYWANGKLKGLSDPNNNVTVWIIDIEGRVVAKQFPDLSTVTYTYGVPFTSRLQAITDALGQKKEYSYYKDDRVRGIVYQSVHPTPSVFFAYDPDFPRLTMMIDGSGTTTYNYWPANHLGALQLMTEVKPGGRPITYQYDPLGRLANRTVDGDTETFTYDAIGRLATHNDDLGQFAIGYLGETPQVTSLQRVGTQFCSPILGCRVLPLQVIGTSWTYDTNANDRRIQSITNSGDARSYTYSTEAETGVFGITESVPSAITRQWGYHYDNDYRVNSATLAAGNGAILNERPYSYDAADNLLNQSLVPSNLNEISNAPFKYDLNGNLIQDDRHTYAWDGENRLISIGYKNGGFTDFDYDGFGRRIRETEIPAPNIRPVPTVVTDYFWCGVTLCEALRSSAVGNPGTPNILWRRYFMEGETHPAQRRKFYYARDDLGSIRDVVDASTGVKLQSYDFDPYGIDITDGPEYRAYSSDFRYAGMFFHEPSGLYLTRYRAYDPRFGRWLSRDPLGEVPWGLTDMGSQYLSRFLGAANLFAYVRDNPANLTDSEGLADSACDPKDKFLREYFFSGAPWLVDNFSLFSAIPGTGHAWDYWRTALEAAIVKFGGAKLYDLYVVSGGLPELGGWAGLVGNFFAEVGTAGTLGVAAVGLGSIATTMDLLAYIETGGPEWINFPPIPLN
jgi:RHS repeat-associated protein